MNLEVIINKLEAKVLTSNKAFDQIEPTAGYTSDLLSCVMAGASRGGVWVTLQAHINIVAVAALSELCAIIITEDAIPDEATINKANEENITLISTQKPSFEVVGILWENGLYA